MLASSDLQSCNNLEVYSLPADETAGDYSEGWTLLSTLIHHAKVRPSCLFDAVSLKT